MSINVLVVDDCRDKLTIILSVFKDANVDRESIKVVQTGLEARDALKQKKFDLLVLDLSLPMRPEDDPDEKGGTDLLRDIDETDIYIRPGYILGVTQHEDLYKNESIHFYKRSWSVLHVEDSSDEWLEKLRGLVQHIIKVSSYEEEESFKTDVCIITALQDPELKAVLNLPYGWGGYKALDETTFYQEGRIVVDQHGYSVIAASAEQMGMVASSLLALKLIQKFRPKVIVMLGICAGVKGSCNIGDVILAHPSWDWQSGKHVKDSFEQSPVQISVDGLVTSRCNLLKEEAMKMSAIKDAWPAGSPDTELQLRIGPMATGASVLADGIHIEEIAKSQNRKLVGVDMEVYGVYMAASKAGRPVPTCFALKSVCDFATAEKDDAFHDYAAYTSAKTLEALFEKYLADFL